MYFALLATEIAELFFVDTTPFVDDYFTDQDHIYNWRGVFPRNAYLSNILKVIIIININVLIYYSI